ncbi:hypothetical protein [Methylovirgula sp. HY1]|uniref:hypothetical protein n=1 Tax=Methylovirgula sp. HY1 TaxID=2822761 RepID=UPI001C5A89F1|nr:hypothetical protein [Methylovirgula sp. HY1]
MAGATLLFLSGAKPAWAHSAVQANGPEACPQSVHLGIGVGSEPITIRTDLTLNEIVALAARTHRPASHRSLGFYLGRIAYKINWHQEASNMSGCPSIIWIRASIALVDRKIEIARDIAGDPCLYQNAVLHYAKHANADEEAFEQFVAAIGTELKKPSISLSNSHAFDHGPIGNKIEKSMRLVINRELRPLDAVRSAAQKSVDTPAQIRLMNAAYDRNG